ncbi:TonB-dependent receptor [Leadbetterella byssophila DSM 17132]|uniref:TonB-dependent receptor n=1 Tax=Leadbetterella byssophila (strain DSM 17132 / JCM 16389 / KACC 11308 / NBRC 106382 / 4M15) TaxID=649349 RepID=E4RSX9_LEAB4|nr:TonB-dependent receptor [Leadbetterella byssophila]ADQ16818.1 TonB-dependent receptor [Leadbetterella byssophila DSM 17132]
MYIIKVNPLCFLVLAFVARFSCGKVSGEHYTLEGLLINQDRKAPEYIHDKLLSTDGLSLDQSTTGNTGVLDFAVLEGDYALKLGQLGKELLQKIWP